MLHPEKVLPEQADSPAWPRKTGTRSDADPLAVIDGVLPKSKGLTALNWPRARTTARGGNFAPRARSASSEGVFRNLNTTQTGEQSHAK